MNIGPSFINQTSGNGSTWQVTNINSGSANSHAGQQMNLLVGDTLYFSADDGSTGTELWAHNTSNGTTWRVRHLHWFRKQQPRTAHSTACRYTIYFSALDGSTGTELWAHNTSNETTWQVADLVSGTGYGYPDGACLPTLLETPSSMPTPEARRATVSCGRTTRQTGQRGEWPTSTVVEEAAIRAIHEYRRWRYPLF